MSEYIRKDDFNFDWDEDCTTIEDLVNQYKAMSLTQGEIDSLGLPERSLNGYYGIYRRGNRVPDVVLNDFETGMGRNSAYRIEIYQIQKSKTAEVLYDELLVILGNSH